MEFDEMKRGYGALVAVAGLGLVLTAAPSVAGAEELAAPAAPQAAATTETTTTSVSSATQKIVGTELSQGSVDKNADSSTDENQQVEASKPKSDKSQDVAATPGQAVTTEPESSGALKESVGAEPAFRSDAATDSPAVEQQATKADPEKTADAGADAASSGESQKAPKPAVPAAAKVSSAPRNAWVGDSYYDGSGKRVESGWVVALDRQDAKNGLQRYWFRDGRVFRGGLFEADARTGWWAYAKSDGAVVRGRHVVGNDVYLADNDGRLLNPGWNVTGAFTGGGLQRYWVDADTHAARTGYSTDGWAHYTTGEGYVLRGRAQVGDRVYLADNDGRLGGSSAKAGWVVTGAYTGGGLQRYWFEAGNYVRPGYSSAGWAHYTTRDGYVLRGALAEGGVRRWADNDGRLVSGWVVTGDFTRGALERYWQSGGAIVQSKLFNSGGGWWAYAKSDGAVVRGAYDTGHGLVYLANNDGRLASGSGWLVTGDYAGGALQRYWMDASAHAARTGFFTYDGSSYYGLANVGYVLRGKSAWGNHVMLADNDGRLASKSGWLVTGDYDGGTLQRYYLEKVPNTGNFYGARTGFFSVSGSQYYGYKDAGYVERNLRTWHGTVYYSSNNDGVMTKVDNWYTRAVTSYINWMVGIASDDSHGYDQAYRWGERGDYDCSSLVISALDQAGVNTYGASYTGNMRSQLTRGRIVWMTDFSKLQRGDILLNIGSHTAVYMGDGQVVQASANEFRGAVGGRPGDQTGREIWVRSYYDYPWDGFLRLIDE